MSTTTTHAARIEKLSWNTTVEQVLAAWPKDRWLAAMVSGGGRAPGGSGDRDRWSIIAQPIAAIPVGGRRGGEAPVRLAPDLGPPPA
ncbi:MAG TPA: hypothetical protein VEB22_14900, partial [Phycisphaerales bacterium]|nr:hypothetical protein [Phycisphaerales bacterium]